MSRKDAYSTIKEELQETLALVAEKSGWEAGTVMELIRAVRLTEKLEAPAQKPPAPPPAQEKSPGEGNIAYTKYLLKNYRLLKSAVDARITSTVQMLDDAQMQMLMEREESVKNQQVRSIAMISAKDRVLFAQLESALEQMRLICEASKNPREQRQYKILVSRYIHGLSLNRTLDLYGIEKSEYFRCPTNAVEKLSVIMFGAERGNNFYGNQYSTADFDTEDSLPDVEIVHIQPAEPRGNSLEKIPLDHFFQAAL